MALTISGLALLLSAAGTAPATAASWRLQRVPGVGQLWAVSCPSQSSCVAVGYRAHGAADHVATALRWSRAGWRRQRVPLPPGTRQSTFIGVSCTSPNACTAVGNLASRSGALLTLAERWNGKRWAIQRTPNPSGLTVSGFADVSCVSVGSCVAVGNVIPPGGKPKALAERWSGGRWRIMRARDPRGESGLSGISCFSPTDCIAVGYRGTSPHHTLAERWDGSRWSMLSTPAPAGSSTVFNEVSCPSATTCIAVGRVIRKGPPHRSASPLTLAERWNGSSWVTQKTPKPPATDFLLFNGVSCTSVSSCTAVGQVFSVRAEDYLPLAERWDGLRWTVQRTPRPRGTDELLGASCSSPRACTAVGDKSIPQRANLLPIAARYS